MMKLSIIIVTYNSERYVEKCLSSFNFEKESEIMVIDNNSQDKTVEIIKEKFPQVRILENRENLGFSKACNHGIKKSEGDFVLFLNPDTEVLENAVEEMISFMKKDLRIGILGPKILNPDKSFQPSAGSFPTASNIIVDRISILNEILTSYNLRNKSFYQKIQYPDWVTGACFLVKKEVFGKIGFLNENYFMYGEEVDFCYRARKAGFKVAYFPKSQVIHYDLGKKEYRWNKFVFMRQGLLQFFKDHYKKDELSNLKRLLKREIILRKIIKKSTEAQSAYQRVLESLENY